MVKTCSILLKADIVLHQNIVVLIKRVFVIYFMKKRDAFSTDLLEKLMVSQVVIFSTFFGT